MSKKVSILEGQKGSKFSGVRYLRTNLSGGGVCEWVPEDSVKLTTKRITKNGQYLAQSEKDSQNNPYYAFSQVTVSVKNSTTGTKDPSTGGDGNEYSVSTDPDTGMLTEKVLPSKIKITTLPNKLEYNDGEAIDMIGAVVKAYKADGTIWESDGYSDGIIPLEELAISPDTAIAGGDQEQASSDLDISPLSFPINVASTFGYHMYNQMYNISNIRNGKAFAFKQNTTGYGGTNKQYRHGAIYATSQDSMTVHQYVENDNGTIAADEDIILTVSGHLTKTFTHKGKTVNFTESGGSVITDREQMPSPSNCYGLQDIGEVNLVYEPETYYQTSGGIAWAMIYGDTSGGGGEITVTWNRPEDFKPLTDTFEIEVTPSN